MHRFGLTLPAAPHLHPRTGYKLWPFARRARRDCYDTDTGPHTVLYVRQSSDAGVVSFFSTIVAAFGMWPFIYIYPGLVSFLEALHVLSDYALGAASDARRALGYLPLSL